MNSYYVVLNSMYAKLIRFRALPYKTLSLAFLAGALISLGNAAMLVVRSGGDTVPELVLSGICFSFGLFAVVMCGAELFTGDVIMSIGLFDGRWGIAETLEMLALVWLFNMIGATSVSMMLTGAGFHPSATADIIAAKSSLDMTSAFMRGIACNFIVCFAVWVSHLRNSLTDSFFAVLLPVTAFVMCGFEHSIANMYYLPFAFDAMLPNVLVVTAGNVFGGLLFCGLMAIGMRDA